MPDGYFPASLKCSPCNYLCKICSDIGCSSCITGYKLYNYDVFKLIKWYFNKFFKQNSFRSRFVGLAFKKLSINSYSLSY